MGIVNMFDDGVNFYESGSDNGLDILKEEKGGEYELFIGRPDALVEPVVHWVSTGAGVRCYVCDGIKCPFCALIDGYMATGEPALKERAKKLKSPGGGITVVGVWNGKEYVPMLLKIKKSTREALKKVAKLVGKTHGFEVLLSVGDDWRRTMQYLPEQRLSPEERERLEKKINSYDLEKFRYVFGRKIKDVKNDLTDAGLWADFQKYVPNWDSFLVDGQKEWFKKQEEEMLEKKESEKKESEKKESEKKESEKKGFEKQGEIEKLNKEQVDEEDEDSLWKPADKSDKSLDDLLNL